MTCPTDVLCAGTIGARAGFRGGGAPVGSGIAAPGWRIPTPRTRAEQAGDTSTASPSRPGSALNDRDRDLVRHLAAGRSTTEIAAAMSVSSNTARTRIRRVAGKLDVRGRAEVVRAARSLGVV